MKYMSLYVPALHAGNRFVSGKFEIWNYFNKIQGLSQEPLHQY